MDKKDSFHPQTQAKQPGLQYKMNPIPESEDTNWKPSGKLKNKTVIITGGDSGIGKAIAILFAKEGANIAIIYANEHKDAEDTKNRINQLDAKCLIISGDIGDEHFCKEAVESIYKSFGSINILINNAAEQHVRKSLDEIDYSRLDRVFRTNIYSMFFMIKASLHYLKEGSSIINTTSITAYMGHSTLLDYSATKGAIVSLTRSLALSLSRQNIRVNAVAPGPVWTPLIPSSFEADHIETFGADTPLGRAGQPSEIAPSYLFLASNDSSYITGQVLHPNGGRIVNG